MIDFGEDEQVLFKHRAQVKTKDGEVVVTNTRFVYHANDGADLKQFTWANIAGVKYSPPNDPKGRAMVLLKTVIKGDEDVVITLVGSSKESNFTELENLKTIISKIRKAKTAPSNGPAATKNEVVSLKRSAGLDAVVAKKRRQLLESDRYLAKQYRDLVESSKLISDEDFWASHAQSTDALYAESTMQRKGKQNSLLAEMFSKDSSGVINVSLTVELKQNIFAMYPEVKRAFEAEVPLKRSETEFWTIYFQSEFYNGRNTASQISNADGAPQRDDLFARYSDQPQSEDNKRKLGSRLAHPDIDLTSSFGDYRAPESTDAGDVSSATANVLPARYNRNSALVVDSASTGDVKSVLSNTSDADIRGTHLSELVELREPTYIQVKMNTSIPATVSAENAQFSAPREVKIDVSALRLDPAEAMLRNLESCVPTTDRSSRLFALEINKARKVANRNALIGAGMKSAVSETATSGAAEQQYNPLELLGIGDGNSAQLPVDDFVDDGALLDEQFKQVTIM